jgi:hypothetical protein
MPKVKAKVLRMVAERSDIHVFVNHGQKFGIGQRLSTIPG